MQHAENKAGGQTPPVPLTIEGSSVLHQMLRVRWPAWRGLAAGHRTEILDEAASTLAAIEKQNSAAFGLLGHKGDVMLVHLDIAFQLLAIFLVG